MGYVLAPLTVVSGVRQVPAGHSLVWRGGEVRLNAYWDAPVPSRQERSRADYEEEFRTLFDDDRMLDYVIEETDHVEPGGVRQEEG